MANGIHLHQLHNGIDDSWFGLDDTVSNDLTSPQFPLFDATSGVATPAAAALTQVLYLTEPGTTNPISVSDINQGQLGDCFLLSPLGEEALFHSNAIMNMIHNNGNGTETVTLYEAKNGTLPTFGTNSFKAVGVTVNNVFSALSVDNGAKQDVVGTQKEIWPQVVEKAVATLDGGYNAIANGGYPF